jgi:uncharacterized membrane protein
MSEQVRFLMSHPLQIGPIFLNTIKEKWPLYYESFIGVLGWMDTYVPFSLTFFFKVMLLVVGFIDGDRHRVLTWRVRLLILLVFAASLFALGVSIYVAWTPTGADHILGLQGRYFIPISPLLLLSLCLRRGFFDLAAKRLHLLIIAYLVWALAVTLQTLVQRYYLHEPA